MNYSDFKLKIEIENKVFLSFVYIMPTGNREMEARSPKSLVCNNIYNNWPLFIQTLFQWILFWGYNNTTDLFHLAISMYNNLWENFLL